MSTMPAPIPWPLLRTERFWRAYAREVRLEELPELRHVEIAIPASPHESLVVALSADLHEHTLYLAAADGRRVQLGWDDDVHWHPSALRWTEAEAIARAAARFVPELAHPGIAILLLRPFVPLGDEDDVAQAHATLRAAWRALGFAGDVAGLEATDFRGQRVTWKRDARGFEHPDQPDDLAIARVLYSLRHPDNDEFPFAELASLVDAARAAARPAYR